MSIVTDRRCDGCGTIRSWDDNSWLAVIPAGWDGIDRRLDFCDEECLRKAARRKNFRSLVEGSETWADSNQDTDPASRPRPKFPLFESGDPDNSQKADEFFGSGSNQDTDPASRLRDDSSSEHTEET